MSRLGKKPLIIPTGTTFVVESGNYVAKGPKGELIRPQVADVIVKVEEEGVVLSVKNPEENSDKMNWGLAASLINGMLVGVSEGFVKRLEINGVGYKAEMKGSDLILNVGHSHPVTISATQGVDLKVEKNIIVVSGINKELVGQIAANIRKVRPPEPYKGKGIKYEDEVIKRKVGKQIKGATA